MLLGEDIMKKLILALAMVAGSSVSAFAEIKDIYFDDRIAAETQAEIKNKLFSLQVFNAKSVVLQGGQFVVVLEGLKTIALDENLKVIEQ